MLYPLEDFGIELALVVDVRDCDEVEGIVPVDFLFLLGRGGTMLATAGSEVG